MASPSSAASSAARMPSSSMSSGLRLPRCWYSQYVISPPTTWSDHQSSRRMSATHVSEMFQSSIMSWSSKIITLGTTDRSQRSHGEDHDSWYSQVNSSNPSTSSG